MDGSATSDTGAQIEPLDPSPLSHPTPSFDSTERHTTDAPPVSNYQGDHAGGQNEPITTPDHMPLGHHAAIARTNSAPSSLEAPSEQLLSQEAHQDAIARMSTKGTTTSLSTVSKPAAEETSPRILPTIRPSAVVDAPIAREDFVQFINSPRGQNAIVEQSPEGRYVRFMEKLGSGASKDVYRAYDTTEGIEVAWNVVNLAGVPKNERNRIVNEVRLLERLHHQNIISFHGSWVNRERQEVNFVTEILSSGTLKSFIEKVQVIRWKIAKRWAVQILKGLDYLHSQDPPVIHRDLKCDNIFINGTSGDLRIGDLGLSTVHRNGKVLSVLGTPEFMAPDLYEESAYDEKVDIYAFGMCLLEIFTKEIPYRECNNAAQIYRKVLRGDLPRNLHRLKSESAREFIMLCLGYKDQRGKYVRPSASELLTNPFLQKSDYDDDEVEVLQPMQERPIMESPSEGRQPLSNSQDLKGTQSSNEIRNNTEVARPRNWQSDNSLDEESDRFDEMPDSEVNMKRVTVLMGRGEELKEENEPETEDDENASQNTPTLRNTDAMLVQQNQTIAGHLNNQNQRDDSDNGSQVSGFVVTTPAEGQMFGGQQAMLDSQKQYLVAAAVIEEDSPHFVPYEDDMLKLIITLPVEGQPQNVQFDFHLVQDDPVQVAREMVAELGIPQEAILEISETISGIARQARMKQDKHNSTRWQNQQGVTLQGQQQSNEQTPQPPYQTIVYHQQEQPNQPGLSNDVTGVIQFQGAPQTEAAPLYHHHQQSNQVGHRSESTGVQFQGSSQVEPTLLYELPQQQSLSDHQIKMVVVGHAQSASQTESDFSANNSIATPQVALQPQMLIEPPVVVSTTVNEDGSLLQFHQQLPDVHQGSGGPIGQSLNSSPMYFMEMSSTGGVPESVGMITPQPQVAPPETSQQYARQVGTSNTANSASQPEQVPFFVPSQLVASAPQTVTAQALDLPASQPTILPQSQSQEFVDVPFSTSSVVTDASHHRQEVQSSGTPCEEEEEEDEEDDEKELTEEMRRLDEDFQKNMLRAQKVFDNRMDNLQRSKLEKEFQHQKTLEKHEKERIEFEKRAKQEEIEQNRRIEEMQREWDRKRDELAKAKAKKQGLGLKKLSGTPRQAPQTGQGQNALTASQPTVQGQIQLTLLPDHEESPNNALVCPQSLHSDSQRSTSSESSVGGN